MTRLVQKTKFVKHSDLCQKDTVKYNELVNENLKPKIPKIQKIKK
jgi:hypothetical protein